MLNLSYTGCVFLVVGGVLLIVCGVCLFLVDGGLLGHYLFVAISSFGSEGYFQLDGVACLFAGTVMYISGLVSFYSKWYVGDVGRFLILVFLFVFSMVLLVLSPSFFVFIWGWDLLGLVSYCLVMYYQDNNTYNAGMITALSNRVGDTALLLSVVMYSVVGSWDFFLFKGDSVLLILMVLVGITKSAQLPFCAWLPAAMAAPTPVSALVHSSTLVTAGVYLLIRYLEDSGSSLLLFLGLVTSCMAGFNAMIGFDFKKMIALSTLSQLGLMMTSIGFGYSLLAFYHLLTHAVVKALLFLSAGGFIHNSFGLQDIRLVFGGGRGHPWLSGCLLYSSLALGGLPFLSCFYSKESILQESLGSGYFVIVLLYVAGAITSGYSLRLIYYLYSGGYSKVGWGDSHEMLPNIVVPTGGLLMMSVLLGGSLSWVMLDTVMSVAGGFTVIPWLMVLLALVLGSVAMLNKWGESLEERFVGSLMFLPHLSGYYMSNNFLVVGGGAVKYQESGWSEMMGGQGSYNLASVGMIQLHKYQMMGYVVGVVIWIMLLVML